ncbi:hypothetical protein [Ruegeria atlantica]|uniref:Uncharacterized protein n=1 Tax=Ruegeria atlantica TaxID=81569 RepID=A0A0P1EB62_9RHOB|nr:hypothetical protein [Ruegeria atlantica]CUH46709.1 hypothetical protein RUA4292_00875 [Ruegeria atlantica]
MNNALSYPHHGSRILLFWCAAMFVYFLMVFGSLADIERITGVRAFDMRPNGYSYADALALISALGEEGRRVYLTMQIPLDTMYPALLAISSASSLYWLSQSFGSTARWYRAVAAVAYLAAIADYAENGLIVWMLNAGLGVPEALVTATSLASVSKSIFSTIVYTTLLIALAEFAIRRMRQRPKVS